MTPLLLAAQPTIVGIALGALSVVGIAALRVRRDVGARTPAVLLVLGVSAYAIASLPAVGPILVASPPMAIVLATLVCGTFGFYAAFARASFDDRPASIVAFWPAALLILTGQAALHTQGVLRTGLLAAYMGFSAVLLVHVTLVIARGSSGDLVAPRRRLRGPAATLAVVTCSAALIDIVLSTAARYDIADGVTPLMRSAVLATLAVAAAATVLGVRPQLTRSTSGSAARADDALFKALAGAMEVGQAWRREGLTVSRLSAELGAPEYRTRRVIHARFGARNFPAFVNAYRIEAAKARLAADEPARTTVAEVAFDVGFSSLTAFNRAFRDATGEAPTLWRRRARPTDKS